MRTTKDDASSGVLNRLTGVMECGELAPEVGECILKPRHRDVDHTDGVAKWTGRGASVQMSSKGG